MKRILTATALGVALAAGGIGAYAANQQGENDAMAISQAKIALVQAIQAAEQHANGKAAKAEFEHGRKGTYYEVEVVSSANQVFDVRVDANTGAVISSVLDKADGGHDRDDD